MPKRFLALAAAIVAANAMPLGFQQNDPAALAAQLTGTWRLNKELSPTFVTPRPGRERGGGGGPSFNMAAAPQRGARGGGDREPALSERPMITDAEAAAQAALTAIQQIPDELTIAATAAEMKLVEARGPSLFKIDGKNTDVAVPDGTIKVKSRWDRALLRQEFSSAMRKLTRTWTVDANDRLVLGQWIEGIGLKRRDVTAVFDRQ